MTNDNKLKALLLKAIAADGPDHELFEDIESFERMYGYTPTDTSVIDSVLICRVNKHPRPLLAEQLEAYAKEKDLAIDAHESMDQVRVWKIQEIAF